ncbi:MAG: SDR family oxidoreductase [Cyanobacteria bacterium P01_F01_bin.33]
MASISGQIALITGASSGIGAACARSFAEAGAKVMLAARRHDLINTLARQLQLECNVPTLALSLDVSVRAQVETSMAELASDWSEIDILVNNAGLSRGLDKLYQGEVRDWEEMIDTNIKGLLYVTRALVPGMVKRDRGHVINIGSIAGHQTYPNGNVYCGTKAAVRAISEGLKQDLHGTSVRVSSVDPGIVETEFSQVRFRGDDGRAVAVYQNTTPLVAEDVADAVLYCATRPAHVNVSEMLLLPTDQSSSTLIHRRSSG